MHRKNQIEQDNLEKSQILEKMKKKIISRFSLSELRKVTRQYEYFLMQLVMIKFKELELFENLPYSRLRYSRSPCIQVTKNYSEL